MSNRLSSLMALVVFILGPLSLCAGPVMAQEYPTRLVEMLVAFGPGSNTDRLALTIIPYLEKELGQKVLPNYKSGGGGTIGTTWLARAKPDGYNIGITPAAPIVVKPLASKISYSMKDFIPIAQIGVYYTAVIVPEKSPWKTMSDLIRDAKKEPDKYTYASSGPFSMGQLTMEAVKHATGINIKHVPFEGGGKVLLALLGEQVDCIVTELRPEYGKDGQTRVLTIVTGSRVSDSPGVPIFKELGYDLALDVWMALIAPKGTPESVTTKIEKAAKNFTSLPEFQEAVKSRTGVVVEFLGSRDLAAKWDRENKLMVTVLKNIGVLKD